MPEAPAKERQSLDIAEPSGAPLALGLGGRQESDLGRQISASTARAGLLKASLGALVTGAFGVGALKLLTSGAIMHGSGMVAIWAFLVFLIGLIRPRSVRLHEHGVMLFAGREQESLRYADIDCILFKKLDETEGRRDNNFQVRTKDGRRLAIHIWAHDKKKLRALLRQARLALLLDRLAEDGDSSRDAEAAVAYALEHGPRVYRVPLTDDDKREIEAEVRILFERRAEHA